MKTAFMLAIGAAMMALSTPALSCGSGEACADRAGKAERAQVDAGAMRAGGPKMPAAIAPLAYSRPALPTAATASAHGRRSACATAACVAALH